MIRNRANQTVGVEVLNVTTGLAFVGAVTVYVTGDNGTQAVGLVDNGAATSAGNGLFTYRPARSETDYAFVAYTFIGTGAVPVAYETYPETASVSGAQLGTSFNANEVILDAFLDLGIMQPGETPGPADAQFALRGLNQIVSSFQNQPRTFPFRRREVFDVVSEQSTYTMGPGGDFDTDRPASLNGAGLLMPSASDATGAVEIQRSVLTDDAYEAIAVKDLQSSMWTAVYFNPTYAAGLARVRLWPVPSSTDNQLVLYWGDMLTGFANLTAVYDFPPGVIQVFRYHLDEMLCPSYGKEWTPLLERLKNKATSDYKRQNYRVSDLAVDSALTRTPRGGYIIQTGGYR